MEHGRPLRHDLVPGECAISAVTIGELRQGVLAANDLDARSRRLKTLSLLAAFKPIPIDLVVAANWSELKVRLKESGRKIGINDSWIAATALAHRIPVVTQDQDFLAVPGLEVILI